MTKYESGPDPYCYPETTVLVNIPGLTDPAALDTFERVATQVRGDEGLPAGQLNRGHYLALHRHLFQDVYKWAGQIRTVGISKGVVPFCPPVNIQSALTRLFDGLAERQLLQGRSSELFVHGATHFLAELNAIHAFREGNGRTQLAFMSLLARQAGHPLQFSRLEPEPFLAAMIASFEGDEGPLREQFREML